MTKKMLVNTIDAEEKRMAIIEDGRLIEFNLRMAMREPIIGNIFKGVVQRFERGLQAAFVDYGAKKSGFLSMNDVSPEYLKEGEKLTTGQEILVKVLRDERGNKGAMLTSYISLPGRYIVLIPNKSMIGISRKIDDDSDRKRLRELMEQIAGKDDVGYIIRTVGLNRTKQELLRDYQMLMRLWKDIQKKAEDAKAPALIYEESDFAIQAFRDYFTSDIEEILVDDVDFFKKMRDYCRAVSARNVRTIKLYKDKIPLFDKFGVESQIVEIFQQRVALKSGGYLIINPTEAMITIDVNSGRGTSRRDVEETAYRTNIEAANEIARQLRLRDLGGLIVIDFIDMNDRKHNSEVEKTFKNALSVDRARIQMSRISRFGILELSRQKKQSAIQEISYAACPHCKGSGLRPSIEYMALGTFRKIKSKAVEGSASEIKISLPYEVSNYLLNQKRGELHQLENLYGIKIHISGNPDMVWGDSVIQMVERKVPAPQEALEDDIETVRREEPAKEAAAKTASRDSHRKRRRPRRNRHAHTGPEKDEPANPHAAAHDETQASAADPGPPADEHTRDADEEVSDSERGGKGIVKRFYDLLKG
jgi:ribonuclease E